MTKKPALFPIVAVLLGLAGSLAMPHPAHAQLFGESDEEKAARQQHEDAQDAQIAQIAPLTRRINDLEDRVRSLVDSLSRATGENETLSHRLDEMSRRMDSQQKDFAYRLCMLSAQQLGASGEGGLDCVAVAAQSSQPPQTNAMPGGPRPLAPGPGILGSLPAGQASSLPPPPSPSGPAKFDAAMNLLAKAQFDEARSAFRAYADANPDDSDLSSQAIYWVGNIDYVQKNYPDAARTFAEEIKKYPDSPRAPDSMLKLGQSLLAMGQKTEGCTALGALQKKYPDAADTIAAASGAARASSCRR